MSDGSVLNFQSKKTNLQCLEGAAVTEEVVAHRLLWCALLRFAEPVRDLLLNLVSEQVTNVCVRFVHASARKVLRALSIVTLQSRSARNTLQVDAIEVSSAEATVFF